MKVGGIFSALRTTLSGLSVQMKRMEVISENMANADKISGPDGKTYHRKAIVESAANKQSNRHFREQLKLSMRKSHAAHLTANVEFGTKQSSSSGKNRSFKIVEIEGEKSVYNPNHPRADKKGYVKMANVNTVEEMVEMIAASRTFEANISVMKAAKKMAKQAMEI